MIRALARALAARWRLARHVRRHGDQLQTTELRCLVPDCPVPRIASHVPIADALALCRAHGLIHHPRHQLPPGACGVPLGTVVGVWCTEARGHPGAHRHYVGHGELDLGETRWHDTEDGPVAEVV